jgi:hypothetical protein
MGVHLYEINVSVERSHCASVTHFAHVSGAPVMVRRLALRPHTAVNLPWLDGWDTCTPNRR